MDIDWPRIIRTLKRSAWLLCPVCGQSSIVKRPFHIRHHCPACRSLFKREDGFFVGAILANVVTTKLIILVVFFFWLLVFVAEYETSLGCLFILLLIFPLLSYYHI